MARNEAIQTFASLHRSFSLERKVTKSSRGKIMASAQSAYRLDFQASCHKRRYMKIKPIVSPSGGRCSDFSPFLTHPARISFVCPVPARSFYKHLLSDDKRQGRNISGIRTIRGHASTSGRPHSRFESLRGTKPSRL